MKLVLKRITTVLYQSDSILELELDPLSTSGVDYWSQEARIAKLSLVYSTSLKNILEGSLREVKAGFHTFIALIYHGSTLIFAGVIADGAYQVEYHTPSQKTIALEITCFMGLLLTLAEDRPFTLSQSSLNPVLTIPSLIGAVLFPASSEPDPESLTYTNADLNRLMLCVGPINFQYAHLYYNFDAWLPLRVIDHLLIDARSLWLFPPAYDFTSQVFGYICENQNLFLVFWEFYSKTRHGSRDQKFRYRKYHLNASTALLVESIDTSNTDPEIYLDHLPAPDVVQLSWGIGDYRIENHRALYSGPVSPDNIEVVPGTYNVKDLLGEFLRLANAVLFANNYSFQIHCRLDENVPSYNLTDPLQFEIQPADDILPELSPVAVASASLLSSISLHYKDILAKRPLEFSLKTHVLAPDFLAMNLASPFDLVFSALRFDSYFIVTSSVAFNPDSGEIDISGRGAVCASSF